MREVSVSQTVSVVVPGLGRDVLTGRIDMLLESISTQTALPKEVILIFSSASEELCKQLKTSAWLRLPPDVTVVLNCSQLKLNQADARNFGLGLARGELIMFSDADDPMHHQRVEIATKIFSQHPNLKALAHSYTKSSTRFQSSLIRSRNSIENSLFIHDELVSGSGILWGDSLTIAAQRMNAGCKRRCWFVHGMVPGASIARRSVLTEVPFPCNDVLRRNDGGCLSEDSLWFRAVLRRFSGKNETLYVDLPLIFYIPSGHQMGRTSLI